MTTFERRVAAGSDDAEQRMSNGKVNIVSSDVELVVDEGNLQTVGLRFQNVLVPQGATIHNAWVQFTTDPTTSTGAVTVTIRGHAINSAPTFTTATNNISSRATTSASQTWSPPDWPTPGAAGAGQQTTNLAAVVQEIVNRPLWGSGNALALIMTGASGRRVGVAYDGSPAGAPLLHIEFTAGGGSTTTTTSTTSTTVTSTTATTGTSTTSTTVTSTTGTTATSTTNPTTTTTIVTNPTSTSTTTTTPTTTVTTTTAPPATVTFERRVSTSSDDAEQRVANGAVNLKSSDVELVVDEGNLQVVGIRFQNVLIPQGATIQNAWVQFTTDPTTSTGAVTVTIRGQATNSAPAFTKSSNNISSRATTGASQTWSPPDWLTPGAAGSAQRTTNLAEIVQEIVDRPLWQSGNALAFIVSGASGRRVAVAYDQSPAGAPLLHVEYLP